MRLDAVALRKRAATKGDHVVEVKPGEEVLSVNVSWTVETFVEEEKKEVKKSAPKKAKPVEKKLAAKAKPAKAKSQKGKKKK